MAKAVKEKPVFSWDKEKKIIAGCKTVEEVKSYMDRGEMLRLMPGAEKPEYKKSIDELKRICEKRIIELSKGHQVKENNEVAAGYILTDEEYGVMCENFYKVKSVVKLLNDRCRLDGLRDENVNVCDLINITRILLEKLNIMQPLLGK